MKRGIRIDQKDNVAVVAQDTVKGDLLNCGGLEVQARDNIPLGHKIALAQIEIGAFVVKFGVPIGKASQRIETGDHVHTHNLEDITDELCKVYEKQFREMGA